MTIEKYFGKWLKVLDIDELNKILKWIKTLDSNSICPSISNIFKAFNLCTDEECKVIFIGQDPYSDKYLKQPRATGILFGNDNKITEDYISPSLTVIKNSVIRNARRLVQRPVAGLFIQTMYLHWLCVVV